MILVTSDLRRKHDIAEVDFLRQCDDPFSSYHSCGMLKERTQGCDYYKGGRREEHYLAVSSLLEQRLAIVQIGFGSG